jgi:uncharacterized protein (TIGR00730 family)
MSRKKYPDACESIRFANESRLRGYTREQLESPAYRLAFDDQDFLLADEQRGLRLMLELDKPEQVLQRHGIANTIAIYGSARILSSEALAREVMVVEHELKSAPQDPRLLARKKQLESRRYLSRYYEEARRLSSLITAYSGQDTCPQLHVITGGGPGIMEAANLGAHEGGGASIGLNIVLPHEQAPNAFVNPEYCFQFHYFAIRKMHFLMRARALVVFPGGWGTLDEMFESLTLVQTKKISPLPILIFGREFWNKVVNFEALVDDGMIATEDLELFHFVDTAEEAWDCIKVSVTAA